jgi:predicted outer membrane repeat protein
VVEHRAMTIAFPPRLACLVLFGVAATGGLWACGGDESAGRGAGGASGASSGSGNPSASGSGASSTGAGGNGSSSGSASGGGGGGPPTIDPTIDCPDLLAPVAESGAIEVVGDGSAASCSEQALQTAVGNINASSDGGTLQFSCGGAHTITLTSSLFFSKSATVDGGGEITLSGGNSVRVIELDHYLDFVVQRITIRDGFVAAGSANESGAGLLSPWFGTLKVIDATFENNHSASLINDVGGGAIYAGGLTEAVISGSVFRNNSGSVGGAVLSRSTNLRVAASVFFENSATSYADSGQYGNGGGLYIDRMWLDAPVDFVMCGSVFDSNHATQHGSALFSYNLEGNGAAIDRCSFRNNDMAGSPGGGTGSVYHQGVPLRLTNSTIAGNSTGAHAGGLFLGGGSDAEIENCTFEGNSTPGNAGALWAGNGQVQVTNCTFAGNDADYGPVIFKGSSGAVTLTNVLFAGNTTANQFSALACHETFDDGGGNVQWPDTKNNGNGDTPCAAGITFADPLLAPLADNGGPNETMALGAGSPAIDVGNGCPMLDQRGMMRVGPCDAGAFEYQP